MIPYFLGTDKSVISYPILRDLGKNSSLFSVVRCLILVCETTVHIFTLSPNSIFVYIKIIPWKVAMKIKVGCWKVDCVHFVSWTNDIWICGGVWFTVVHTKIRDLSKLMEGRDRYFPYLNADPVFASCSLLTHYLLYFCTLNEVCQYLVTIQYFGDKWSRERCWIEQAFLCHSESASPFY